MLKWIFKKQVLEGVKAKVEDSHAALKQVIPILLKEDSDDLQPYGDAVSTVISETSAKFLNTARLISCSLQTVFALACFTHAGRELYSRAGTFMPIYQLFECSANFWDVHEYSGQRCNLRPALDGGFGFQLSLE